MAGWEGKEIHILRMRDLKVAVAKVARETPVRLYLDGANDFSLSRDARGQRYVDKPTGRSVGDPAGPGHGSPLPEVTDRAWWSHCDGSWFATSPGAALKALRAQTDRHIAEAEQRLAECCAYRRRRDAVFPPDAPAGG